MPHGRKLKIERPTFAKAVAEVIKPRLTKLISNTMSATCKLDEISNPFVSRFVDALCAGFPSHWQITRFVLSWADSLSANLDSLVGCRSRSIARSR